MTATTRVTSSLAGLLALLLPVLPSAAWADQELKAYTAEYKVKISFLGGRLRTNVEATDSGFTARSVIEPTGLANLFLSGRIEEYSEFETGPVGVRPQHYESVDTLSSDPARMSFDFDYDEQAVTGHINDEEFRFEFDGPVHDRVSIQYELMHNLLNEESGGDYALLDGDELKELTVDIIGRREVKVPYGRFQAVGIQHREKEKDRVNTLWCVEELGYLPVVIEQYRDGELRVRAELRRYQPKSVTDPGHVAGASSSRD